MHIMHTAVRIPTAKKRQKKNISAVFYMPVSKSGKTLFIEYGDTASGLLKQTVPLKLLHKSGNNLPCSSQLMGQQIMCQPKRVRFLKLHLC